MTLNEFHEQLGRAAMLFSVTDMSINDTVLYAVFRTDETEDDGTPSSFLALRKDLDDAEAEAARLAGAYIAEHFYEWEREQDRRGKAAQKLIDDHFGGQPAPPDQGTGKPEPWVDLFKPTPSMPTYRQLGADEVAHAGFSVGFSAGDVVVKSQGADRPRRFAPEPGDDLVITDPRDPFRGMTKGDALELVAGGCP